MTDMPPTPRSEMMDVVMTVVETLNDVITALRTEVAALAESEKRSRQRLTAYLAMVGIVAAASVTGITLNYKQGQNVKTIVNYISECQSPGSDCKKANDAVIAGAVVGISKAVFDSTTCVLLTVPTNRTDENVKMCRDQYLGK